MAAVGIRSKKLVSDGEGRMLFEGEVMATAFYLQPRLPGLLGCRILPWDCVSLFVRLARWLPKRVKVKGHAPLGLGRRRGRSV